LIAWQLEARLHEHDRDATGQNVDLRCMTGVELSRHLAALGT